jgi:hypothetical protein
MNNPLKFLDMYTELAIIFQSVIIVLQYVAPVRQWERFYDTLYGQLILRYAENHGHLALFCLYLHCGYAADSGNETYWLTSCIVFSFAL